MSQLMTNVAFSGFQETTNGNSQSRSEDGNFQATLYKNEAKNGVMQITINKVDNVSNPRIVTLIESPEKGAAPGTPRKGKSAEHFFFRAAIPAKDNQWQVFRANLFTGNKARLVVNSEMQAKQATEGEGATGGSEEESPEHT